MIADSTTIPDMAHQQIVLIEGSDPISIIRDISFIRDFDQQGQNLVYFDSGEIHLVLALPEQIPVYHFYANWLSSNLEKEGMEIEVDKKILNYQRIVGNNVWIDVNYVDVVPQGLSFDSNELADSQSVTVFLSYNSSVDLLSIQPEEPEQVV